MTRIGCGCRVVLFLALLAAGCGQKPVAPVAGQVLLDPEAPAEPAHSTEPSRVELSDAKVVFVEEHRVQFEVKYRFVQGQPAQFYECDIYFPGTSNHGVKPLAGLEIKTAGVIKDTIMMRTLPVKTFEISMSEAPSPRSRFKKISNVISGEVQ